MKAHLLCILILSALLMIQAWHLHQSSEDRQTAELQRDEAFELTRKAQEKALYWFDVHARTVAHYNRRSE